MLPARRGSFVQGPSKSGSVGEGTPKVTLTVVGDMRLTGPCDARLEKKRAPTAAKLPRPKSRVLSNNAGDL